MKVPFVDLKKLHDPIRNEIDDAISSVVDRNAYIKQKDLQMFEEEMAGWLGAKAVTGTSCGTCSLQLALEALGIGSNDEVITAVNTAIPTGEAITASGANVVFADIKPGTFTLDPASVHNAITSHTKAIIPVHLYGFPVPMNEILNIASEYNLYVIEDVAQAQGAAYHGKKAGTFGILSCFSFFPSKNLGAFGDGGAVAGMDSELINRTAMLANHGRKEKYVHEFEGYNYRLDNLQAAVLRVKLKYLDQWNRKRRAAAALYDEGLSETDEVITPVPPENCESVYHLYVIRIPDRDSLAAFLKEKGIATGLHYPRPLHLQPAYARLGLGSGCFPEAEKAAQEILSLPMFPDISPEQTGFVCRTIKEYYKNVRK